MSQILFNYGERRAILNITDSNEMEVKVRTSFKIPDTHSVHLRNKVTFDGEDVFVDIDDLSQVEITPFMKINVISVLITDNVILTLQDTAITEQHQEEPEEISAKT